MGKRETRSAKSKINSCQQREIIGQRKETHDSKGKLGEKRNSAKINILL